MTPLSIIIPDCNVLDLQESEMQSLPAMPLRSDLGARSL